MRNVSWKRELVNNGREHCYFQSGVEVANTPRRCIPDYLDNAYFNQEEAMLYELLKRRYKNEEILVHALMSFGDMSLCVNFYLPRIKLVIDMGSILFLDERQKKIRATLFRRYGFLYIEYWSNSDREDRFYERPFRIRHTRPEKIHCLPKHYRNNIVVFK